MEKKSDAGSEITDGDFPDALSTSVKLWNTPWAEMVGNADGNLAVDVSGSTVTDGSHGGGRGGYGFVAGDVPLSLLSDQGKNNKDPKKIQEGTKRAVGNSAENKARAVGNSAE